MTDQGFEQSQLRDALSDVTRKERRFLLSMSLIGFTMAKTGMVPSKIPSLGIEFLGDAQGNLLFIVAIIVLYFLVSFIIYAASDYLSWKLEIKSRALEKVVSDYEEVFHSGGAAPGSAESYIEIDMGKLHRKYRNYFKLVNLTSIVRALFDFGLPIAVGVYAFLLLVTAGLGDGI